MALQTGLLGFQDQAWPGLLRGALTLVLVSLFLPRPWDEGLGWQISSLIAQTSLRAPLACGEPPDFRGRKR